MEILDYLFLGTLGIVILLGVFTHFYEIWGIEFFGETDPNCQHTGPREEKNGSPDCICESGTRTEYRPYWSRIFMTILILGIELWLMVLAHAPYNQY